MPYGRIGIQTLPILHAVFALPIVMWGPPHARAEIRLRLERPGEPLDADVGPPISLTLDAGGICGIPASMSRVQLRAEGVHAITVLAGERVLARRWTLLRKLPEWERQRDRGSHGCVAPTPSRWRLPAVEAPLQVERLGVTRAHYCAQLVVRSRGIPPAHRICAAALELTDATSVFRLSPALAVDEPPPDVTRDLARRLRPWTTTIQRSPTRLVAVVHGYPVCHAPQLLAAIQARSAVCL